MPSLARHARALVLIAAAFVAAGGDSISLPLAHLFADHHHEIAFSAASGNWKWVAVGGHHDPLPAFTIEPLGHDHDIRPTAAPLRVGSTSRLSLALIPCADLDPTDTTRGGATFRALPDPAPDIGNPDLALLASMRV